MQTKKWILPSLLLGAVFFIAVWAIKPIGVSTQFSVFSGMIHSALNPDVITAAPERENGYQSTNAYYDKSEGALAKNIKKPLNYDFIFVLAIPLGAFAGYALNKKKNAKSQADSKGAVVPKVKDPNLLKHVIISFAGGFILLYGARMADGCTSGHMMSGIMQGAVSGYVFAASVFAVAIPTAIIVGKKAAQKGGK